MVFKLVGVHLKEGTYEGHEYSNTMLSVLSERENVRGICAEQLKVRNKYVDLPSIPKIPCNIDVMFDRYSNVTNVVVLPDDE